MGKTSDPKQFIRERIKEMGPTPVAHVNTVGVQGLKQEFAQKHDLSCICGWLKKPSNEVLIGAVDEVISTENPTLGLVADTIKDAYVGACEINTAKADKNFAIGAVIGLCLLLVGGLVVGSVNA
ncbi:MAG: hypothetical protein M0Z41_16395 [Peptococcaceae bacterium]|jgi:hypothetical protein|nr:hypothetical protein [Peptococcaceae bacterium]